MAYITCKKCGCQMSDKSEACPMCGTPVGDNIENQNATNVNAENNASQKTNPVNISQAPSLPNLGNPTNINKSSQDIQTTSGNKKRTGVFVGIAIAIVAVAAIAFFFLSKSKKEETNVVAGSVIEESQAIETTNEDLEHSSAQDAALADEVTSFFHNEILNKLPITITCGEIKNKYGINERNFYGQELSIVDHEGLSQGIKYSIKVGLKNEPIGFYPQETPKSISFELFPDENMRSHNSEILDALKHSLVLVGYTDIFEASIANEMFENESELAIMLAEETNCVYYKDNQVVSVAGWNLAEGEFVNEEEYDVISISILPLSNFYDKGETISNTSGQYVVIDATDLRLRYGPSTSADTYKWSDGSNRHPNKGEKYRYLGESGDFYKIDYKGVELWVSKQFTYLE